MAARQGRGHRLLGHATDVNNHAVQLDGARGSSPSGPLTIAGNSSGTVLR